MYSVTPKLEPITYRLPLGEAWYRIRLDDHAEADVTNFMNVMFDGIPPEASRQTRTLIATQFAVQIAEARSKRGIELYVPAPKPHGAPMPATAILTAEVVVPVAVLMDQAEVAVRVARSSAGSRTGVIAGSTAVRIEHAVGDPNTETETGDASSDPGRIEYVIAVPDDLRWLSIDLGIQGIHGFDMGDTIAEFDRAVAELTWPEAKVARH